MAGEGTIAGTGGCGCEGGVGVCACGGFADEGDLREDAASEGEEGAEGDGGGVGCGCHGVFVKG